MDVISLLLMFTGAFALLTLFMLIFRRHSIKTGFLVNNLLVLIGMDIVILGFVSENTVMWYMSVFFSILFIIIMLLGIYVLIFALFWNGRIVSRKEGDSFSNRLTYFGGMALIFLVFVFPILRNITPANWWLLRVFYQIISITVFYFSWVFLNFLTSLFIYQLIPPKKNKDFIIVLGSGLRNGYEVTPLLASRINGAIDLYKKQKEIGKNSKIICSGGQGPDELIPEGEAMRLYVLEQGIPSDDCIAEIKSTTTLENLKFSKEIMDYENNNQAYKCAISSNNYHVFRAIHFANQVGLDAQGIGTKTAWYFLPNALIREFVGFIVMKPKAHIVFLIIMYILAFLNEWPGLISAAL